MRLADYPVNEPAHLVGVRFLNSRPLVAGLEAAIPATFAYTFAGADPAGCATQLTSQQATAALVPVVTLAGCPAARAVPGLGVACRGAVDSVLVISKVPWTRIRRLAVHDASRTSVVLARLLLSAEAGVDPELFPAAPPLPDMLHRADAALVIGDAALALRGRSGLLEVDLGEAWQRWTGYPFVFAQWAARPGSPPGLETLLEASLAWAEDRWEDLLPRWARAHALPVPAVRAYLEQRLHFRLDEEDERGKTAFLALAANYGLLPATVSPPPPAVETVQSPR